MKKLVEQELTLKAIRFRDKAQWDSVRAVNRDWLSPWEATRPNIDHNAPLPSYYGMVMQLNKEMKALRSISLGIWIKENNEQILIGQITLGGIIFGAVFGSVLFTYLFAGILKWWDKVKEGMFSSKHPKKIFTKFNRRVIRIKHRFGLTGIAILTPIFLSIPIGAFLAERFYKDKKKVIIYLSISAISWCFVLYFIYLFFYDTLRAWLA